MVGMVEFLFIQCGNSAIPPWREMAKIEELFGMVFAVFILNKHSLKKTRRLCITESSHPE